MSLPHQTTPVDRQSDPVMGLLRMRIVLGACWWQLGVLGAVAFTIVSRLAVRTTVPFNWDSVDYILALRHFDLARDQPHPPGNPLYVLLGRAANRLIADPNQALIALSILASAIAVWGVALLGARLASRAAGLWAAIFIAVNPMFWLNGEVALAYAPEAAIATLVALVAWRCHTRPSARSALLLGLVAVVAGGLRPTLLPLLGPVVLFGLYRLSWRQRAIALGTAAVGCLMWLVPLVYLAGGVSTYRALLNRQAEIPSTQTSLFQAAIGGWIHNLGFFLLTLAGAINLLIVPLVLSLWRARLHIEWPSARALLLWLWLLPASATYALVHFGQVGYVLLLMPPIVLLILFQFERAYPGGLASSRPPILLLIAVAGALAVAYAMVGSVRDSNATWATISERLTSLPPAQTVILTRVTGDGSFRTAGYLFPRYDVLGIDGDAATNWSMRYSVIGGVSDYRLDRPATSCRTVAIAGVRYVVVLDSKLTQRVEDRAAWTAVRLPGGGQMLVRDVPEGSDLLDFARGTIAVAPTAPNGAPPACGL